VALSSYQEEGVKGNRSREMGPEEWVKWVKGMGQGECVKWVKENVSSGSRRMGLVGQVEEV